MREFIIDGQQFSTLRQFYDEVGSVLVPNQYWGHNLDAFNDILCWPYMGSDDEEGERYRLVWRNSELSRQRLGYDEAVLWLTERAANAHPTARPLMRERLKEAAYGRGPTVFDWLVEIIHQNNYYVELVLE